MSIICDSFIMQVQALHAEKRALDRYLESRQAEITELEQRLQSTQASRRANITTLDSGQPLVRPVSCFFPEACFSKAMR